MLQRASTTGYKTKFLNYFYAEHINPNRLGKYKQETSFTTDEVPTEEETAFQKVTVLDIKGKSFIARLLKLHRKFGIGEIYLSQLEFGYDIASILQGKYFRPKDATFSTVLWLDNILRNMVLVISHIKLPGYILSLPSRYQLSMID